MWLNQRTLDAIRLMAELSARWPNAVKAADLSEATGITFLNVQKTAHGLVRAGLLEAERGRYGGLRLVRPAHDLKVAEIVRAFEPKDCPVNFLPADQSSDPVAKLMFRAHRGFFQPLEETTLADIEPSGLGTRPAQAAPRARLRA
jgi:Rrf2 family transcriptional regulator, nitric oxide-sensitive transcriptional repressor